MADMKTLTNREEIWDTLKAFRSWIPMGLSRNIVSAFDRGYLESISLSANTSVSDARWDGLLQVNLTTKPSIKNIIDYIVSPSHANEISMPDDHTLRLWWS